MIEIKEMGVLTDKAIADAKSYEYGISVPVQLSDCNEKLRSLVEKKQLGGSDGMRYSLDIEIVFDKKKIKTTFFAIDDEKCDIESWKIRFEDAELDMLRDKVIFPFIKGCVSDG